MITLKNGDGIKWPHGKRIAVLLTFDFDAEYLRYSVNRAERARLFGYFARAVRAARRLKALP